MPDLTQAASIARELESARTVARRLFGSEYEAKLLPWKATVEKLSKAWGCRPIEVPVRLEKERALPPNPMLLFAAVVEMTEAGGG